MAAVDPNTLFCRRLVYLIHEDVREAFPTIPHVFKACSITSTSSGPASRRFFFAQIDVPDREPFYWEGRADNAWHARHEAWVAYLKKAGAPGYKTEE